MKNLKKHILLFTGIVYLMRLFLDTDLKKYKKEKRKMWQKEFGEIRGREFDVVYGICNLVAFLILLPFWPVLLILEILDRKR